MDNRDYQISQLKLFKDYLEKNYGSEYKYITVEINNIIKSIDHEYINSPQGVETAFVNLKTAFERLNLFISSIEQTKH